MTTKGDNSVIAKEAIGTPHITSPGSYMLSETQNKNAMSIAFTGFDLEVKNAPETLTKSLCAAVVIPIEKVGKKGIRLALKGYTGVGGDGYCHIVVTEGMKVSKRFDTKTSDYEISWKATNTKTLNISIFISATIINGENIQLAATTLDIVFL